MRHFVFLIFLVSVCGSVSAQYKCIEATGKVAFQQTPCLGSQKQQVLKIQAVNPPQPSPAAQTSSPQPNADQRMLNNLSHDRRIRELQQQIEQTESNIYQRNAQMDAELALLRQSKSAANNNLAGATWEQSISSEMQAVTQKYKNMNDADFERLRQLRLDFEKAKIIH